jgi:hypothetical protein
VEEERLYREELLVGAVEIYLVGGRCRWVPQISAVEIFLVGED